MLGIICAPKQEKFIKEQLQEQLPEETMMILKKENIDNLRHVTFHTIAIFSYADDFFKRESVGHLLEKARYIILNADEDSDLSFITTASGQVITYGFHTKSTVTVSSVKEEGMMVCLQRTIQKENGDHIEPQEIFLSLVTNNENASIMMGLVSILFVLGKEIPYQET